MNANSIVQAFIACINAHDADAIAAALTSDHVFIDSLGTQITGREALRAGWRAYLRMVPDYHLSVAQTGAGNLVGGRQPACAQRLGHPGGFPRAGPQRSHRPVAGVRRQRADPALHAAAHLSVGAP
jgi:ketosteroid isomerase-like protein